MEAAIPADLRPYTGRWGEHRGQALRGAPGETPGMPAGSGWPSEVPSEARAVLLRLLLRCLAEAGQCRAPATSTAWPSTAAQAA